MAQRTFNQNLAPPQQGNPLAITGFVLSLVSIALFWIPFVNILLWVLTIVFSAVGLSKANKENRPHRGLAIAGICISAIPLVLIIVFFVFLGAAVIIGEAETSSIGVLVAWRSF